MYAAYHLLVLWQKSLALYLPGRISDKRTSGILFRSQIKFSRTDWIFALTALLRFQGSEINLNWQDLQRCARCLMPRPCYAHGIPFGLLYRENKMKTGRSQGVVWQASKIGWQGCQRLSNAESSRGRCEVAAGAERAAQSAVHWCTFADWPALPCTVSWHAYLCREPSPASAAVCIFLC